MPLSIPHTVRLNPNESQTLDALIDQLSNDDLQQLIELDRECREGYRNHSGRRPQPRALLIRRSIELGLPLLIEELHSQRNLDNN